MANQVVRFSEATGQALYAFPRSFVFSSWITGRVAIPESSTPNLGKYTATLDDAIDYEWAIFSGASQPSSWDNEIGSISLDDPTDDIVLNVQPSIGYGEREVATNTIEIANDAQRVITRTITGVTIPACYFAITDQQGNLVAELTATISGSNYTVTIPRSACQSVGEYFFALRSTDSANLDYDSGILRILFVAKR
jgi:hypothetical protein